MSNYIEILTAKHAGFCFGVKRAVDMAFHAAAMGSGVYTLGPVIHNPQAVEQLRSKGVSAIDDICNDKIKTLVIRTHGVPREISEELANKKYKVVDATCPFVKNAQQYAKLLREDGYQVIIIGNKEHPEVKGLMSYAGEDVIVVDSGDVLPGLKSKVGIVVQTTQPVSALKRFVSDVAEQAKEIKVFNTICNSTLLRLKETEEMTQKTDAMVVVGGKNSANTSRLAQLCRSMSIPTYHIETASEIKDDWFLTMHKVGVTAGASTPDWIIKEVEERIRDIGGAE
ncbi:4-hydroxy-3-methylbut-2-enyl diphosphate reductase [Thermodesulfovibrionales bacterium]|nr:4-hydroxy-3-methylbut-2-enyl diphosphate reductase [Thermodesulfovibrionales bacterium]